MPEEVKKDEPMVDIDSSGPDAEVELQDEANESEAVESTEDTRTEAVATEPQDASDEQQETEKDQKKEELENYSKDVQRRIAKLTKKWREAERQREEAIEFARAQQKQKEEVEKKYGSLSTSSLETKETSIKAGMEAAKAKLANARADGNMEEEIEAQQAIAQLAYAQAELTNQKKAMESEPKEVKQEKTLEQAVAPRRADPKAEQWAENNSWFGQDEAMTYTAMGLHEKLVSQEGYDPKSDEYYAEIDKRIRLEFPHKFATNSTTVEQNTTKPVQTVASATRSTKSGRKTIRLTPTEVAIAKKLGVSLEDYAKQKKLMKEV
jgi:hypothetical protein